jgi:hypothetical protein
MSNTRRNSRPPETLEEAIRIWREHRATINGQRSIIADLKEALTRSNETIDQLRAAQLQKEQ